MISLLIRVLVSMGVGNRRGSVPNETLGSGVARHILIGYSSLFDVGSGVGVVGGLAGRPILMGGATGRKTQLGNTATKDMLQLVGCSRRGPVCGATRGAWLTALGTFVNSSGFHRRTHQRIAIIIGTVRGIATVIGEQLATRGSANLRSSLGRLGKDETLDGISVQARRSLC
jgi:hypothetical protein